MNTASHGSVNQKFARQGSPVELIKEKLSVEEVIGSYIKVEQSGANFKAKCPFHNEKTPSFFISPDRGTYYCFGCSAKGDIFSFVEQFEGTDFKGALRILADRAGVNLSYEKPSPEAQARRNEKEMLYAIMETATVYCESELEKGTNAEKGSPSHQALEYLRGRGITDETRKAFRIGYVPDGWRNIYDALKAAKNNDGTPMNFTDNLIEKAGLIKRTDKGYYDRFRDRIMFPICDSSGRVIAFSGRILPNKDNKGADGKDIIAAKYLNSPDTPLYDKSSVLYGIDKAKNEIRLRNFSILVEGQMDLVLSHQAGIKNAVAASGTALSDVVVNLGDTPGDTPTFAVTNLGLVQRISPNVIIAFDSDKAGRSASMRAAKVALSLGMDVKIASLPDGKDPADLIRENRDLWVNALRVAKPVIHFLVDTAVLETEDTRKLPRVINDKVLPFVAQFSSSMEQAQAVSYISSRTNIPERAIWDDFAKVKEAILKSGEVKSAQAPTVSAQYSSGASASVLAPFPPEKEKANGLARIDLVTRKLFSVVFLGRDSSKYPELIAHIEAEIQRILGVEQFSAIKANLDAYSKELSFEAEVSFNPEQIQGNVGELLHTLEIDYIKSELTKAMAELTKAELSKNSVEAAAMLQKCQDLSLKLRNVAKLATSKPKK